MGVHVPEHDGAHAARHLHANGAADGARPFNDVSYTSDDGLTLYARDYPGHGGPARLPVVCIHGLTRNSGDFDELAPWIAAQGRRVLALDVRGRGQSARDPDPAHYNPAVYAGDVIKLAHDLGIERAVFVGTSMGGIITMTLALRRLNLIAAAVLNDVGPVISQKGLSRIATYAGKGTTMGTWEQAAEYMRDINQPAFPSNDMTEWNKWARRAFSENDAGQLVLHYDPNIALPLRNGKLKPSSWLSRLAFRRLARNRPTLLVRGSLSDLVEQEQASYMQRAAPSMQYAEVPGVGHAPMLTEAPARQAIERFLSQVD
ncbi:alpha/beta hydrolase [Massilia sp. P8910]|uniref:alpha/beta fold hydrolase n=1 Tax=Massilia antarctica TaxID=2765360 RepID=UPI001E3370D2|nr:alpha/beta hydrolase [Massilia antarctica]MCE3607037.1 alpha/beta hydrolase [Massilia antarctica]